MHSSESASPPPSSLPTSEAFPCRWLDCSSLFSDPELLYNHLCNDHIGRKSTNNLCLTCRWKDCNTSCAKRDHITSHLRVHTPLKPHVCEICKKSFKRPQDLKKHEKIHTEEHHAQHKHSKAITVSDPGYLSRVRGDHQRGLLNKPLSTKPSAAMHAPVHHLSTKPAFTRTKPYTDTSPYAILPTPSPDLDPHGHHARHISYDPFLQGHNSWNDIKSPQSVQVHVRNKRSLDCPVDDFLSDMKKRKVNPSYDSHMAERLNNMVYSQEATHEHSFNPRSISLDIRTPEELAAVNEFLVTLGRDVTGVHHRTQNNPASSDRFSPYFDTDGLNQLGLAGMPGLPTPASSFSNDTPYTHTSAQYSTPTSYPSPPTLSRSSHPSQQNHYGSVYALPTSATHTRAVSASTQDYTVNDSSPYTGLYQPTAPPQSYAHSTPPLDSTSPHSSSSTPSNATPPHQPTISGSFSFDYVRAPPGAQPPIQLAAQDYSRKVMHNMVQLKSAPGSVPEPIEPKLSSSSSSSQTSLPAKLSPLASAPTVSLSSQKLYPMLLPEDSDLKLPSLKQQHEATPCKLPSFTEVCRPPSPPSRSPDTSRGTTPTSSRSSPGLSHAVLPSLRSITEASEVGSNDEHELVRKVSKINLEHHIASTRGVSVEERRKHAELIRSLLVKINHDYKQRYGTPRLPTIKREPPQSPRIQDVEMAHET